MPRTKLRTSIIVVDGKPDLVRSCELASGSLFVSPFFTCSFGRCNTPAEKSHLLITMNTTLEMTWRDIAHQNKLVILSDAAKPIRSFVRPNGIERNRGDER